MSISIQEAANLLNITEHSLILELEKPDCPYGYTVSINRRRHYFISREYLNKWIENNPQKYSNDPNYTNYYVFKLKRYSTTELL